MVVPGEGFPPPSTMVCNLPVGVPFYLAAAPCGWAPPARPGMPLPALGAPPPLVLPSPSGVAMLPHHFDFSPSSSASLKRKRFDDAFGDGDYHAHHFALGMPTKFQRRAAAMLEVDDGVNRIPLSPLLQVCGGPIRMAGGGSVCSRGVVTEFFAGGFPPLRLAVEGR